MDGHPRRTRVADVASAAGVSKTAVSFAFHRPERLNAATVKRIRDVAESLGYRPPLSVASSQPSGGAMTLGLLAPQDLSIVFENPFFGTFSGGLTAVAEQAGYGVLLLSPLRGSLPRAIARGSVDGVVAVGLSERHPDVVHLRHAGMPLVLVDGDAYPEHGAIESNDEVGARAAARHLLALGHRDFLVVGVEPSTDDGSRAGSAGVAEGFATRRLLGYRQALSGAGLRLRGERIVAGPATFDAGLAAFHRIWEDGLRPTAVLAMTDVMAIGVMHAAGELGVRVPLDVSVVGFDDLEFAAHSSPPLTTVHQPIRLKGEEAGRLLIRMMTLRDHDRPVHKVLETRLIIRASTAPPIPARAPAAGTHKSHRPAPARG